MVPEAISPRRGDTLNDLWARIERHDFEPATPLNFTARLARDKGWTLPETRRAILAYRRFCFLAMVSDTPVTPSEAVDEVWHHHLTYTRDYWDVWCRDVLGRPLHHDPTPGGEDARLRYRAWYAQTLALHEEHFGPPEPDLWPATNTRFGRMPRFLCIDRERVIVLPRLREWPGRLLRLVRPVRSPAGPGRPDTR